jgi:hypothetical protein
MRGVFKDGVPVPRAGMVHRLTKARIVALLCAMERVFAELGRGLALVAFRDEIVTAVVHGTPAYGMDFVLLFRWFYAVGHPIAAETEETVRGGWDCDYRRCDNNRNTMIPAPLDADAAGRLTHQHLGMVHVTSLAGSAMLHRTLVKDGEAPAWDPGDWDVFLGNDESLHFLDGWLGTVFRRCVFNDGTNSLRDVVPLGVGNVHGTVAHKWHCGQICINGCRLDRDYLCHFDVVGCATHTSPPYTHVIRTFAPGDPITIHMAVAGLARAGKAVSLEVERMVIQRSEDRVVQYTRRFGGRLAVHPDVGHARTFWYTPDVLHNIPAQQLLRHAATQQGITGDPKRRGGDPHHDGP